MPENRTQNHTEIVPPERPLGYQIPYDPTLPLKVKELRLREHKHVVQDHTADAQLTPSGSI